MFGNAGVRDESLYLIPVETSLDAPRGVFVGFLRQDFLGDHDRVSGDVLLEYQLTRPSDAQADLAHLLEPLDRNPDLPLTLEVYLDHDLDRRTTAAALHSHASSCFDGIAVSA